MQILNLDKEEVRQAAQAAYLHNYIAMEECDLYLEGIVKGRIKIDGVDHPMYVSTNYVYEDRVVNGNKTRFKVTLTCFYVKKDKYEVVYDSYGTYFVAYKENDNMKFIPYEDLYDLVKGHIHVLDEENLAH